MFEDSTTIKDIADTHRQEVIDFIDGVNTDLSGEIQICTIADYYAEKEKAAELTEEFSGIISQLQGSNRFFYEYEEEQNKARYTFLGTPRYVGRAMDCLCAVWDRIYFTHSLFNRKAVSYARYRPSYPKGAVDLLLSLPEKEKPVIADIGSGTGKMSELLIEKAGRLYAVEPNADMREAAEHNLGKNENYVSVNAAAEDTGLDSGSVDLIIAAESYHWFDSEKTRLEFKRILKDKGYVMLLWNEFGNDPYEKEDREIEDKYRICKKLSKSGLTREDRAKNLFGAGNYKSMKFDNTMKQTFEEFLGGKLSASYSPDVSDANYPEYEKDIRGLFDKYSSKGLIESRITTVCFWGQI